MVFIGTMTVSFLLFVYSVSTDLQRKQFIFFFQQIVEGNINFSILEKTQLLALGLFDSAEEKQAAQSDIRDNIQRQAESWPVKSVQGKYRHLYSCQKKQKLTLKETILYSWKDAQGQMHYADHFPKTKDYYALKIQHRHSTDFFKLNLDSRYSQLPAFASDKIKADVNQIYNILTNSIGVSELNPIQLNLKLFDNHEIF